MRNGIKWYINKAQAHTHWTWVKYLKSILCMAYINEGKTIDYVRIKGKKYLLFGYVYQKFKVFVYRYLLDRELTAI